MKARDSRKQRLYDAERAANLTASDIGRRLLLDTERVRTTGSVTIESCQRYVDHLTQSAWFQRRWARRQYRVRHKAYGSATCTGHTISLPPWARDEWVLLHEVAHGLTCGSTNGVMWADHGPEFAGVFLTLVAHRMGPECGARLRAEFKAARVPYTMKAVPKPTRTPRPPARPVKVPSKAAAARAAAQHAAAADDGWWGTREDGTRRRVQTRFRHSAALQLGQVSRYKGGVVADTLTATNPRPARDPHVTDEGVAYEYIKFDVVNRAGRVVATPTWCRAIPTVEAA